MRRLLFFFLFATTLTAGERGLWVVRDALTDQNLMANIVDYAVKNAITDIYIQVRARGEVYYPTAYNLPVRNRNEALGSLIASAHKKNIKIHAWINANFIWSGSRVPGAENHLFSLEKNSLLDRNRQREPGYYIYPANTGNLQQIKSIISEMINKYHVDGIHLDYFRYPFNRLPLSVDSRMDFMKKYYVDPLRIEKGKGNRYDQIIREKYRTFLKNRLTDMLVAINKHTRAQDSTVKLSLAVKPNPYIAEVRFMQPWEKWLKEKLCDFVVVMNYDPNEQGFMAVLDVLERKDYRDKVLIGIGVYNISAKEVKERIKKITVSNFAGYALFSYNYIRKHTKHLNNLKSY